MNPARYARLKEIVLTAAALPAAEREKYLDGACAGDDSLRAEADSLLAHRGRTAPGLRTDALAGLAARALADAGRSGPRVHLPERIAAYRILGILGEGGMGVVYRAEQEFPVRREVALKLMRAVADSPAVAARFESERQTLARMDHPNIARLFDAGSTADGRPFFAMELVRGAPLTDYCREARVDVRGRLRLFLDVCRAVRHAHRSGIIHRDLKPSNILVTVEHDQPVPKVIDFSIAKALGDEAAGAGALTRTGQLVGTLEYMSPEQAQGAVHALDTRSDVYALGVVLYELLAERLPLDLADLPLHEAVRRIADEPPTPLRRTATTATGRVDADLDTLVRKCLEKDPERRYGSAAELAEDLERYLESRPIVARPPSALYQLRKLVVRHRAVSALLALTLLFLLVFTATVTMELGIQRRERTRAEAAGTRARRAASRAERINAFLQDLLASAAPSRLGRDVTVREVLDRAAARLESDLADEPEARADAYHTLGVTYGFLADMNASARHREKALAIRRSLHTGDDESLARELVGLAGNLAYMPGRGEEGYRLGREGIAMWRRLTRGPHPELADALGDLAWRLGSLLSRAERESMAREAVAMWETIPRPDEVRLGRALNSLGLILREEGKLSESETQLRRAVEIFDRKLGATHEFTVNARDDLGVTLMYLPGRDDEAYVLLRDALPQVSAVDGPDHILTACATRNLALWMLQHYRLEEARALIEETRRIWRVVFEGDRSVNLAHAAEQLARIPHLRGDYRVAETLYREMMSRYAGLGIPPAAVHALNFGLLLDTTGRHAESDALLGEALDQEQKRGPEITGTVGRLMTALGCVALDSGRLTEADPLLSTVRESLPRIEDEEGCLAPYNAAVLARLRARQGRTSESAALFREASGRLSYCVPRSPLEWRHLLPVTADFLQTSGEAPEASHYRAALARLDGIIRGEDADWWKEGSPAGTEGIAAPHR